MAATEQAGSIPTTGVAGHLSSHPTWSGVNGLHKASTVGSSAGRVTDTRCSVETAASVQPPRQPPRQPHSTLAAAAIQMGVTDTRCSVETAASVQLPRQPHSTLAAAAIQMGVTDTRCSVETAASVQPPRQPHSTLAAAAIQMGVTDTRCSVQTAASVQPPRQPHSTLAAAAIQMGFNQQLVTKAIEDKRTSSGELALPANRPLLVSAVHRDTLVSRSSCWQVISFLMYKSWWMHCSMKTATKQQPRKM